MKAIILDRDGTIIKEKNYLTSLKQVKILSSAPEALKKLQKEGYKLIVFTNQSAVARGLVTERGLRRINKYIQNLYREKGVRLAKIYYCPHHPEGKISKYRKVCSCRKPATGMLLKAKRDFGINFKQSFVIGDSLCDIEAGKKVGASTILVLTGQGKTTLSALNSRQRRLINYIAPNLLFARRWILRND